MPRRSIDVLRDIEAAIADIRAYSREGGGRFSAAPKQFRDAILLKLLNVAEAVRHLPPESKAEHPGIEWRAIGDLGNRIRHDYFRVDPKIIDDIVAFDLAPLETAIRAMIDRAEPGTS